MSDPSIQLRSRYYDALLSTLDRVVQPEISSDRARFIYAAVRRMLANFAVANERTPHLPEHFASLFAGAPDLKPPPLGGEAVLDGLLAEGALLDAVEEKTRQRLFPALDTQGEGVATTPALTEAVVQAALRRRLAPDTVVHKMRLLAGGRSKQTIILTLNDGAGAQIERVIRRDLIVDVTGSTVLDEYAVIVALADRGTLVPRPFFLEPNPDALGSAYMLMEKVEGATAGDVFEPPKSAEPVFASARALARLHAIAADEIAPALRDDRRVAPDAARLLQEISALQKGWAEQSRAPSATLDAVFAWLRDNVASIEWHRSVVHGDYSFHNIMFDGERVSAIMDWELVRIGHPAEDLGYIRAAVIQRMPWPDFMEAYSGAGGQRISERTMMFYAMLGKLRLIALLLRARGFFEAGYTDDLQIADVGVHHMARLMHQLSVDARAAYSVSN